ELRAFWRRRARRPGRPPTPHAALIRDMAAKNQLWGAERVSEASAAVSSRRRPAQELSCSRGWNEGVARTDEFESSIKNWIWQDPTDWHPFAWPLVPACGTDLRFEQFCVQTSCFVTNHEIQLTVAVHVFHRVVKFLGVRASSSDEVQILARKGTARLKNVR